MFRCRYLPFDTAQNVRNFHEMVINYVGKMISRIAVSFHYNWIALIVIDVIFNMAINHIFQAIDVRRELKSVTNNMEK